MPAPSMAWLVLTPVKRKDGVLCSLRYAHLPGSMFALRGGLAALAQYLSKGTGRHLPSQQAETAARGQRVWVQPGLHSEIAVSVREARPGGE